MIKPNISYERMLWKRGYRFVAGLDEVGVGPLAGPVVVSCVVCKKGFSLKKSPFVNLRESKSLSPKQRSYYASLLRDNPYINYSMARVYPKTIDKLNIFQATRLAMHRAIKRIYPRPDFLLIDGAALLKRNSLPQRAVVRGDTKIFSIAAASVIAKATRDNIMKRWAHCFPAYGFDKHKGYATKSHRKVLKIRGPSRIHRLTFIK